MEPAKIDWKRLEWHFVEDELYEHINAPKWVDFLSLDHSFHDASDESWFCRPDCKHPKTAEDFLRAATTPSKVYVSEDLPLRDQNKRDVKIKRRVPALSSASPPDYNKSRFKPDRENQNPYLFTPPMNLLKSMTAAIKSSEEKKKLIDDTSSQYVFQDNKVPPLRSTLSAKNLLSGRPILNQITEFCNELKRLATRARERENAEISNLIKREEEVVEKAPSPVQDLSESDRREKERKPLLELSKARLDGVGVKGKLQRKKRRDEAENMPASLDLENVKDKREEILQQIRINPPSPQCFSASCGGPNKTTSSKDSKSRLMERAILQEVEKNKEVAKDSPADNNSRSIATVDGRGETKALDMLWFLKPCTL